MTDLITGPGRYVTNGGGDAMVLEVLNGIAFGRAHCHGWWTACQWRIDTGEETWNEPVKARTDIIGPYIKPRPPIEGWVNVNDLNPLHSPSREMHWTRSRADTMASGARITCVYVRETEPPK